MSSLIIIFTMLLGLTNNVFAETAEETEKTEISVVVTNILRANKNIDVPNVTFQYSFTKDGLVNFQGNETETIKMEVLEDATQPDLDNTKSQLQAKFKIHTTAYKNLIDNKKIYKNIGGNFIPKGSDFEHAGVYSYTIKQEPITEGMYAEYLTCSQAVYKLYVYVENSDNGLVVSATTAYKIKDDNGDAVENPAKVDLTKNTYAPSDGSDLVFINDYNPNNVGLTILNIISGNYADMTRSFDFEMTMLNPEGITTEHTYKAVMIDENTNLPISDELLSFTTDKATDFQMKHNQRLTFVKDDYVIDKEKELTAEETEFLPAGSTFVLISKAAPAYYCKYLPTLGGEKYATQVGNVGRDVKVYDKYLNLGLNQIEFNQCYKYITATGVLAKTMPALIMLILAVFGIVIGGRSRWRNAE